MTDTQGSNAAMPDVQGYKDSRQLDITRVGIKSIRSPVIVRDKSAPQHSVATFALSVFLPQDKKGTRIKTDIPVTTLCPCSKEISRYGAHSQRSMISIDARLTDQHDFYWEDVIVSAEQQASAQLYSQLKRADEKFVTEHAYDNPRFVEDLIREVATVLNKNSNIASYELEVENFESIHNHSAYATISK